ncbi:phospholipase D family protein [Maridesulfovibrio ferrireducens]|uniref:phospholipase D family protein n=1 Tax=Maridesulfovibrio ferrireducens TaxID=246191 RepID=UPI001A1EDA4B|nr:phospholipase D family protein [Maridesulfovibrio ferrireducens]MBI9110713.1 phospholipase D family protein [Maridesulfovibrio ferrireducens]
MTKLIPLLLLSVLFFVSACATRYLPEQPPQKIINNASPPAERGKIADLATRLQVIHGQGKPASLALDRNDEALRWRLLLTDLATESIDLQTFILHNDASANLLLDRLIAAADRGVRVRILIDDFLISNDKNIPILDFHPNIEVHVFNPWRGRETTIGKGFEFITRMDRLNQRMHNKLMVIDNHASIIGGRNISDEYFGINSKFNFRDMEILTIGPIVREISHQFDIYWNDALAYPGDAFAHGQITSKMLDELRKDLNKQISKSQTLLVQFSAPQQGWDSYLEYFQNKSTSGKTWVVYDDPPVSVADKTQVRHTHRMNGLEIVPQKELLIISAYFIPDDQTLEDFKEMVKKGVSIKILTNSLGSNDQIITNSAYKFKRIPILKTGAELYELRSDAKDRIMSEDPRVKAKWLGLHSKLIIIDRKISYVGSLNWDPRSIAINTEIGLIIDDPVLGEQLAQIALRDMRPENAWRVLIDSKGKLYWKNSDRKVYLQPARNLWRRIMDAFYTLLPIKDQL